MRGRSLCVPRRSHLVAMSTPAAGLVRVLNGDQDLACRATAPVSRPKRACARHGVLHNFASAVSAAVRARPVAQRAAFEAQIPTEVLRQDSSRSPVHHEGSAGKAALSVSRRDVHRT